MSDPLTSPVPPESDASDSVEASPPPGAEVRSRMSRRVRRHVRMPTTNLGQRVVTALVGATVAVTAAWMGGWIFGTLVAAVSLLAQVEVYSLTERTGARPLVELGLGLGAMATLRSLVPQADAILLLGVIVGLTWILYRRSSETPLQDATATAFGVIYPAIMAGSLIVLRESTAGWLTEHAAFWLTTAVLFGIWGSDTLAYFTGRAVGRHPLFSRISPNKTIEGAVGGGLGAVLLIAGFKLVVLSEVLSWVDVLAVGAACGTASQFGDLVESLFKRSVGVKDSGSWLPGHGGMLDRVDAALFAAPLVLTYFELTRGL